MPSLQQKDSEKLVCAVEFAAALASNPTAVDGDDNKNVNNEEKNA